MVLVVAACASEMPRDLEPCRAGDGYFAVPRSECQPQVTFEGVDLSDCAIACTGPAGCDGAVEFEWRLDAVTDVPIEWCGCDGRTYRNDIYPIEGSFEGDFFTQPTTRWQWYGSCEDPCWGLRGELFLGRYPPHPRCHACEGATEVDGRCRAPDGFAVADACCAP